LKQVMGHAMSKIKKLELKQVMGCEAMRKKQIH